MWLDTLGLERNSMRMIALGFLLFTAALAAHYGLASANDLTAPISGDARQAVVFDGDSLDINGRHIQLAGIDAPELGQTCKHDDETPRCGMTAAYELRKRLQLDPRPLRCWPQGKPINGAEVATCAAGEDDLALALLQSGYAWALADAQIDYRLAEEKARAARMGLWSERGETPTDWRARMAKTGGPRTPEQGCVIAGMVADDGKKKIYYGPLDPDYAKQAVDPAAGERWFCGEEEARKAGWRRPGERSAS